MLGSFVFLAFLAVCFSQQLNFNGNPANVNENAGTVTFQLVGTGPVSVETSIVITQQAASTAAAGYDFGGSGTYTVTIAALGNNVDLVLPIEDDSLAEPDETIVLAITAVIKGTATIGAVSTASTTILTQAGDSGKVRVDFAEPVYVTNEPNDVSVVFRFTDPNGQPTVLNGADSTASLTLPLKDVDTAEAGAASDFTDPTTASITFPVDKTMTSLTQVITINGDATVEATEVFHLSLGAFTADTYIGLGATRPSTQVRIRDNDFETLTCVGKPEYNRRSKDTFQLYAFTSLTANRDSIAWSKSNLKTSCGTLKNRGTNGKRLTLPRPKRSGRRFGAYAFTATGTSGAALSCNAFIRTKSEVKLYPAAAARKYTMIIYPSALGSTDLCPKVTFGVDYDPPPTRQKLKWTKDGVTIQKFTKCQRTVSKTTAAGVYTISRANRGKAWFAIIELKLAECPEGQYRNGKSASCDTCKECFNGGICGLTGSCVCPPCFEGDQCELVATDVGGFGEGTRFTCATDLGADTTCKGLLFSYGGMYGSSCACGWSGSDCSKACKVGTFGADCSQTCHCMTPANCNIRTGVCSDGDCAAGYSGENCQKAG